MSEDHLDPSTVSPEFVKEGADWLAVFNPRVPRVMDVKLKCKFVLNKVICGVRFSPDGKLLAVGLDGAVHLYDVVAEEKIALALEQVAPEGTRDYVRCVAFSVNGKFLAAGSEDKLVRVWDLQTAQLLHTLSGHKREVYALEFTPDSGTLISGSGDRTIRLWDLSIPPGTEQSGHTLAVEEDLSNSNAGIMALAVAPDGVHVASGALDGTVRVWNTAANEGKGAAIARWQAHAQGVYSIDFILEGAGLVTGSLDRTLKRWQLGILNGGGDNSCLKTLAGHKDCVLATATLQEGQMLRAASASRDGSVRLWDLKTGDTLFSIQGHRNTVTAVDLSKDGNMLVSGSGDGEARIWTYTIY
ncbi:WD40 repeat-like protein [Dentipellis sp. KUC8613]|nr:WD40 repeat-like protein [Dentipellis sp. KUC8613]